MKETPNGLAVNVNNPTTLWILVSMQLKRTLITMQTCTIEKNLPPNSKTTEN